MLPLLSPGHDTHSKQRAGLPLPRPPGPGTLRSEQDAARCLRLGVRALPRGHLAASWGLPCGCRAGAGGSASGRGWLRARGLGMVGAARTCSVRALRLHLRQAVGHGQLQVLVLILTVCAQGHGGGSLRWGLRQGRGRPPALQWLLFTAAQLQPQRQVIRDPCGGKGCEGLVAALGRAQL